MPLSTYSRLGRGLAFLVRFLAPRFPAFVPFRLVPGTSVAVVCDSHAVVLATASVVDVCCGCVLIMFCVFFLSCCYMARRMVLTCGIIALL